MLNGELVMSKLTNKQQVRAILGVAALSFRIAPDAVAFKLGGAILDAILPLFTTYFAARTTTALVSAYSGNAHAGNQAILYVSITALLGICMTIWRSLDNYMQATMRYVVEARISDDMYRHFLALDFWRYDDKESVDLYDRALKFTDFFAWIFDRLAQVVSQFINICTAIIALALFKPLLALAIFIAVLPGVYIQFRLSRKQIAHWNNNVEVRRARNMVEWHFSRPKDIAELRLYNMADFLLKHRRALRDKDEKGRLYFEKRFIPGRLLADVIEAVVELAALIWTVMQIAARQQPVGQFVYVQQIVSRALSGASGLASSLGNIDEDVAHLFDYQQFMAIPTIHRGGIVLSEPPKTIEFKNVSFKYPKSQSNVLSNITMKIDATNHVAIVGENGAGKSTLIKLLTGLYTPTSGKILVDSVDLADIDIESWHKQLGVLQQDFIHYAFATVGDNVRYGSVNSPHSNQRVQTSLEMAEAHTFVSKLPHKLDNFVNNWMEDADGNKGTELSGGQWQRLALARDFYRNAPILILDEPTSAIDALAESRIFAHLFSDRAKTLVTISHRLSTVEQADIIYVLQNGQVAEFGTHTKLVSTRGVYHTMFTSQLRTKNRPTTPQEHRH